jgi:hypothetical protein
MDMTWVFFEDESGFNGERLGERGVRVEVGILDGFKFLK